MKKTRWNLLVIVMLVLMPAIVWAQNLPPIADAGPDQNILVGDELVLHGSAWDPNGNAVSGWLWTIESQPEGSSPVLSGETSFGPLFLTYTEGDYVLSLIASDGIAWSTPDYVTIHVAPILPPVAVADADVTSGPEPLTVTFDGSQSYDPQGGTLSYIWKFGDFTPSFHGVSTTHVYQNAGTYDAELTVIDERGQASYDTIQITVTVANTAPTVSPTATPTSGVAPLSVQFAANGNDADGDTLTYAWDFGDGNTSTLADPAHVYNTVGTYLAWVTVSDGVDEVSASVTIHVTDYEVHEISQEEGRYPLINDRRDCIWIGGSGGLYFYDAFTGETKLLDAAATIFSDYQINNNGDVGWYAPWRSTVEDAEVYVYDHSSRTTIQVTNNDVEDVFYKITDDGTVYFVSKQADETFTLNTYVIDTGVTTTVDLNQFARWPEAINANGDVLWRAWDSSYSYNLHLYLAATGTTVPISPLGGRAYDPSMNDRGDVSYRLFASDYHAIMFYDASTGQIKELTRGDPNSVWEPKTSNSGNVVWTGSDTAFDIFYYDYALNTVEQLTFLTDDFWYGYWDKDINDFGDVSWIDWTPRANTSTELNIYLRGEGRIEVINSVTNPEWPQINNNADAVFEGDNSQPWGRGVFLATRAATVDEVVDTIDELTTTGSLDTATAEDLQTSFDEAMEALSAGDEITAEKKIAKFEDDIDKLEKKGELDSADAKKLEDALQEVTGSN